MPSPFSRPIPLAITSAVFLYALVKEKLTVVGLITALFTAFLHLSHPSTFPIYALVTFFLTGTFVTKYYSGIKSHLTSSSNSIASANDHKARNAVQVICNSGASSILILLSLFSNSSTTVLDGSDDNSILRGIACAYAAAAADTFSSELGILSNQQPFLITNPWKRVRRGTNGGVTSMGLFAGLIGSQFIAAAYLLVTKDLKGALLAVLMGFMGTLLDSILGALLQVTVEDKKTGKIIEGANGTRVLVQEGGSRIKQGRDLLNNNGVNFTMTLIMGIIGTLVGSFI